MLNGFEIVYSFIKGLISSLGYLGIGTGMLLESACIPVPSELVLPLAGVMVAEGRMSILYANAAVTIGSLLGSIITYFIGFHGGRSFVLKHGKYFLFSPKHFYSAEKAFLKFGATAVLFGRLLPIVRTFISLPAGITRMSFKKFILFSLLGMIPWNFTLIFLGYKFGKNYDTIIQPFFHKFQYLVIGLLILLVFTYVFRNQFKRKEEKF